MPHPTNTERIRTQQSPAWSSDSQLSPDNPSTGHHRATPNHLRNIDKARFEMRGGPKEFRSRDLLRLRSGNESNEPGDIPSKQTIGDGLCCHESKKNDHETSPVGARPSQTGPADDLQKPCALCKKQQPASGKDVAHKRRHLRIGDLRNWIPRIHLCLEA